MTFLRLKLINTNPESGEQATVPVGSSDAFSPVKAGRSADNQNDHLHVEKYFLNLDIILF